MSFTGHEDHSITLAEASEWTANYRATISSGGTIAHFFGKDAIQAILDQSGCVGIRIYYAIDDLGNKQLVLVGANADENDLYEGLLADRALACPINCSSPNPLNS
ncbi:MAG: hypothetical protein IT236_01215 [Bacteroidia bacterium]|nr:hypothetical protein [Bacteroidia bacterium]